MVQAWFFDPAAPGDQRAPHQYTPNRPVSLEQLGELGVQYFTIDVSDPDHMAKIDAFAEERGYKNRDVVNIAPGHLPNYEERLKVFFEEHIHEDEEIRYILEGSGYFDVRDKEDRWVRIAVVPSDLIIVPAGIYHRFTMDENNKAKAMRLFSLEPKWTPINRPIADDNAIRKDYLAKFVESSA
ncbi:1,2-dihydroxy-3-keto-5-methylthiopentene dioxygenase-like protein [Hyaloraphidium curvatum]|nr:1,2-dihydroxy-3-keto-5-methylthiopentene dioxygenase-like protein [Hyaloraphidium curvatum]